MPSATNGIRVRMSGWPIDEPHRVSSPLELLFDLTFVVAIAAVTTQLAHSIAGGHGPAGRPVPPGPLRGVADRPVGGVGQEGRLRRPA
ncbi:MAG: low temperature requirement protein (LtrA) family protein [Actinomycetia bacterium]|nr:low temperature requirement protein (LtrA) family protein [Actinomycetes bacterium]